MSTKKRMEEKGKVNDFVDYAKIVAKSWEVELSYDQANSLYHIASTEGLFEKIEKINPFSTHARFLILEEWMERKVGEKCYLIHSES